jgi:hypothetical protein
MIDKDNSQLLFENSHFLPTIRSREKNKISGGLGLPESLDKEKTKEELEKTITNCIIKNNSDLNGINLKSLVSYKSQNRKSKNSILKQEIDSYGFKGSKNSSLLNLSENPNRRKTIKMSNLLVKKPHYFPDNDESSNYYTSMQKTNIDQMNSYYNLSHLKENCNIVGTHFTRNNSHTRLPFKHTAIKYDHAVPKYKYKISDINISTDLKKLETEYSKKNKRVNLLNFDPFLNKENFHSKFKISDAELKQRGDNESFDDYYDSIYSQLGKNFRNSCCGIDSIKMKTNYNVNYENLKSNLNHNEFQNPSFYKNFENKNKNYFKESSHSPISKGKIIKTFESKKNLNQIQENLILPSNLLILIMNENSPLKDPYPKDDESTNTEDLINNNINNVNGSKIYEKKIIKVFERVKNIDYKFSNRYKNGKFLNNIYDSKKNIYN